MKLSILLFTIFACLVGELRAEWAENILETLTIQEKIGQLFVVPASPRYEPEALFEAIERYHIGSILIKQAHPLEQIPFMNGLQARTRLPLLCLGDAEWGLGMRMEETLSFPRNYALGSIQDDRLLYEFGKMVGEQCKLVGIHLNLAPVVDVNPPRNPVIGMRAFGEEPGRVGRSAALVIRGMQDAGILACAKHFPGHGDAKVDSHYALPTIPHSLDRLEEVEFAPFRRALAERVAAVMSGHLYLPALDDQNPASLSHPIITGLLKEKWGFQGLVITDALNMKALSRDRTTEEIALGALLAGHDLLLYGAHLYRDIEEILVELIPAAFSAIERGVSEGRISMECIDAHVLKILSLKERLGLHQKRELPLPQDLMEQLHSEAALALQEALFRASLQVINGPLPTLHCAEYVRLWEDRPIPAEGALIVGVNHLDQLPLLREIYLTHPQLIVALFLPPYLVEEFPDLPIVVGYGVSEASERAVLKKGGGCY